MCVIFSRTELTQFHFYYKIYVCLPFPICAMARKNRIEQHRTCFKMVYCVVDYGVYNVRSLRFVYVDLMGFWKILISIERVITWFRVDLILFLFSSRFHVGFHVVISLTY